jgi:dolichol-phosphate mannosyltransferase
MTVIGVRKSNTKASFVKKAGSRLFYAILRFLGSDESTQDGLTDFRLIDRKIIDEYNKLSEHNRVTRNLLDWLGYKRKLVPFEAKERHAGVASYSFRKLCKLAIDGIVKHSTKPLKFIGLLGFFISLLSFVILAFWIIDMYALSDPLRLGITGTAILGVFSGFMIGIVLTCQGLLALYIENIYYETQGRPLYIIEEES